jgi:hypothetical protein
MPMSYIRSGCRMNHAWPISLLLAMVLSSASHAAAAWLGPDGNNAAAVHAMGDRGTGVRVGLIVAGSPLATHEAFRDKDSNSRVLCLDYTGEGNLKATDHDTWVAGVVAGGGGLGHESDTGVAPEAKVFSAKVSRGIKGPEDANKTMSFAYVAGAVELLVSTQNCRVIVTGIAFPDLPDRHPDGQSDWSLLYDYYAFAHNTIFANPSGKQFRAPTVFGDSYNGITTGGLIETLPGVYNKVGSASNPGPTLDGRRKPDVVAPAGGFAVPTNASDVSWFTWPLRDGATSFAAPNTGGVAALLLGLADKTPEPNDGRNVVIKAVIINSTHTDILDRSGRPTDPNGGVTVWNADRGFGRIDALGAYITLKSGTVHQDLATRLTQGWAYGALGPKAEHTYKIEGRKGQRLVCTVVWNRKVLWNDNRSRGFIDPGELRGVVTKLGAALSAPGLWRDSDEPGAAKPNDNVVKFDVQVPESGQITLKIRYMRGDGTPIPYGMAFMLAS